MFCKSFLLVNEKVGFSIYLKTFLPLFVICECSDATEEWRHLNYEPKVIKFAKEVWGLQEQDAGTEVTLPPFSSATVPQDNGPHANCNRCFYRI